MNTAVFQKLVQLKIGGFLTIGKQIHDVSQSAKETGVILRYSYVQITDEGQYVLSWAVNHLVKARTIKKKAYSAMVELFDKDRIFHLWFPGKPKGDFSKANQMMHVICQGYRPQKSKPSLSDPHVKYKVEDRSMSYSIEEFEAALKQIVKARSIQQEDVNEAQLSASKDTYSKTIDLFKKWEQTGPSAEKRILNEDAIKAFAIETACRVKTFIEPIPVADWETFNELQKVKRRKRKIDWVDRELAENWIEKGYDKLTAIELAKAIHSATGKRLSPAAIKKRRERLGLVISQN